MKHSLVGGPWRGCYHAPTPSRRVFVDPDSFSNFIRILNIQMLIELEVRAKRK
jgi:hypothetical protein